MTRLIKRIDLWCLTALILLPVVFPHQDFFYVMTRAGIYAIVCLGLSVLLGFAGQISLGHAAFFGLGAYCTAIMVKSYGFPCLAALVSSVAVTTILAYMIGKPILRLRGYFLALATLGLGEIFQSLVRETRGLTGGEVGIFDLARFSVLGFAFDDFIKFYYLVLALLVGSVIYVQNLIRSRTGRALRAISMGEDVAETLGIKTSHYKLMAFVLSGALAGLGGSLFAFLVSSVSPGSFGLDLSLLLVMMVIVGGAGTVYGAVVGAFALTWLSELMSAYMEYSLSLYAVILILCLIFLPNGIWHGISALRRRLESLLSSPRAR